MTPPARLAAAIELLGLATQPGAPADQATSDYFSSRRYIGAKDRRAIADLVYGVIRRRAALDWWLDRLGAQGVEIARGRSIAALALIDGWGSAEIAAAFDGERHHPAPLDAAERMLLRALGGHSIEHPAQPDWVRLELPEWLYHKLTAAFGKRAQEELAALMGEASFDLRVNSLKAGREEALAALAGEGIDAVPTPLSPLGLRLPKRIAIGASNAFRAGIIEVQDEGSQLAALLACAAPGMRVCDFCAGAGGKSLALAAAMRNQGQIYALEVSRPRLERAALRFGRAGVHNVTRKLLASHRDPWVKRHKASFERVLVDAPCSGSGTWRRNPDAKWRLTPEGLVELMALQRDILESAQRMVKPGGRLIYVTCSLLPEENEAQADAFLQNHADFRPFSLEQAWEEGVGGICPMAGPFLTLTPARHATDGFFVAMFERS
jgi:16S rRNA (cytosine967-C5)-methyltransferase